MLGIHSTKTGTVLAQAKRTLSGAIERDQEAFDFDAVQIFTHGPRGGRKNAYDSKEVVETTEKLGMAVYVHGPYPAVEVWKMETKEEIRAFVTPFFEECAAVGALGWVLHVTKQPPSKLVFVVEAIRPVAKKYQVRLLLEMVAAKPDPAHQPKDTLTYFTPEDINYVTRLLPKTNTWRWCIDTAHLWAGGVSVRTKEEMQNWLSAIRRPDKIYLIHLNGSENELGSGKDKHAAPFGELDKIWRGMKYSESGVVALAEFAADRGIAMIMELKDRAKELNEEKPVRKVTKKIYATYGLLDGLRDRRREAVEKAG
jgi:endonuclease IV